jgi:hypothetical protein
MPREDDTDRLLLTPTQAAERISIARPQIVARLRAGQILGRRDGRRWFIHVDDLPDPPPPNTGPRPIIVRGDRDGWLPGSVTCGDRAPRRDLPPDPPLEEAPWRIIRPADPRPDPEDPSA